MCSSGFIHQDCTCEHRLRARLGDITANANQHHSPLLIAEVQAKVGQGRIGITFCPGKHRPDAMTGGWRRNLGIDLDAIRDWGAVATVTLVEEHELRALKVPDLGKKVRDRHMAWYHLPNQRCGDTFAPVRGQLGAGR
jgi:hypothetical protein